MKAERTVYIDESFFEWMGLKTLESNISYGVLSIPTRSLKPAAKFCAEMDSFIGQLFEREHGVPLSAKEIKATTLNKLSSESVEAVAKRFAAFFEKRYAKLFGFYLNAEGYLKNAIRNDHFELTDDDFIAVKAREGEELRKWLTESLCRWEDEKAKRKGDSGLIIDILKQLVGFIAHFHIDKLRQSFEIVYDSRSPGEDAEVECKAEEIMDLVRRQLRVPDQVFYRYYKGFRCSSSTGEAGLRIADFVAGGYRQLFRTFPEILSDNAEFEILTAKANPSMLLDANGSVMPFYKKRMNKNLADSIRATGQGLAFSHWHRFYANKTISMYTRHGAARHCILSQEVYTDMAD